MIPFILGRTSDAQLRKAEQLKQELLAKHKKTRLEDLYDSEIQSNRHGKFLSITHTVPMTLKLHRLDNATDAILSELKLVFGIGPFTETRLKAGGVLRLADLVDHPRFGPVAAEIHARCANGDMSYIFNVLRRRVGASHPLSLAITGMLKRHELLFLDVETLGLSGSPVILLGAGRLTDGGFEIRQYIAPSVADEPAGLFAAFELVAASRALVTFNGQTFDLPCLKQRLNFYRLPTLGTLPNLDLLYPSRKQFRDSLPDAQLKTIGRRVLRRKPSPMDIPSELVPEFYDAYRRHKNIGPLIPIIEHNKNDLTTLGQLLSKLCRLSLDD
jgi:uncharacterized protein YprB with RNaseH-like and TPR domain